MAPRINPNNLLPQQTDISSNGISLTTVKTPDVLRASVDQLNGLKPDYKTLGNIGNVREAINEFEQSISEINSSTESLLKSDSRTTIQATQNAANQTSTDVINDAIFDIIDIQNIEDNILSSYDNPSYHFKFFVAPSGIKATEIQYYPQYIIAETGATGYFINEVLIKSIPAMSAKNFNSLETEISMTIIEPQGCRLIDHMLQACNQLGIPNHVSAHYWLELYFNGYTSGSASGISSDGGIVENVIGQQKWLWELTITKIDIALNKGGTEYKLSMVPTEEVAFRDSNRKTEKKEVFKRIRTFGDFLTALEKSINNYKNYTVGNNATDPNTDQFGRSKNSYKFHVYDQIRTIDAKLSDMNLWQIRNPTDNITGTKRSGSFLQSSSAGGAGTEAWDISFAEDTPIETMITEVLGATTEAQSLALYGKYVSNLSDFSLENSINARKIQDFAVLFMISPISTIKSFSYERNNYTYQFDYYITPYRTFDTIASRAEIKASEDLQLAKERLAKKVKITQMKKKYDFIYTGLNTEVLNFDISLNNAWFVGLPLFQGQNRGDAATVGGNNPSSRNNIAIVQTENTKAVTQTNKNSFLDTLKYRSYDTSLPVKMATPATDLFDNAFTDNLNLSVMPPQGIVNIINADSSTFAQSPVFNTNSQVGVNDEFYDNNKTINNINISQLSKNANSDSVQIEKPQMNPAGGSIYYVEDLNSNLNNISSNGDEGRIQTLDKDGNVLKIPSELRSVSMYEGNIEGTASKGRSFFSFIMNQSYGLDQKMIDIELEIRGDPYWLGEPNPDQRLRDNAQGLKSRDITSGDSTFILTMGFPENINDYRTEGAGSSNYDSNAYSYAGTGFVEVDRKANGFNGIYTAREIHHTFSNGKFTQKILAYIDMMVREDDVITLMKRITDGQ